MSVLYKRLKALGEARLLVAIAVLSFLGQLLFLRAPVIFGEPYLVAKNIVTGKGFVFAYPLTNQEVTTAYITPLYAWLQVPVLWLGLGERGIQVMNLLFLQAACLAVYVFFRKFVRPWAALGIYALVSFYVPFWILGYALEPNTLNILLLVLTLDVLYHVATEDRQRNWVWLGILTGVQLLLRPDILIGALCFLCWAVITRQRKLFKARGIALALAIAVAMVAPWTVRNYYQFHKFVLVSANSGYNLYVGNNPVATGEFSEAPATPESRAEYDAIMLYSQTHDQVDLDRYRSELAISWIRAHPLEDAKLDARKLLYHWFGRYEIGTQYHFGQGTILMGYLVASFILIAFGIYGLTRVRDRVFRGLIVTLFVYSSLVSMMFFVQSRHRTLKVDPFLVPLAFIGITHVVRSRVRSEAAAPLAITL